MIQVMNLTKAFGDFKALDELSLHVPQGCVYGLVGPNGAGKSTLLRHITGAYRPDSGQIFVQGQPVYESAQVKERMAVIPDDVYYFPQADIRAMKEFYRRMYPKFDGKRYERLKEVFPLNERQPIRRMSKGMQKQAAFWLALCMRSDILLLDEPVDGLDPVMRRQVWRLLLSDTAEYGTTVLVSSHNLRELEDVCDHVGILSRGRLLLERSLADLQEGTVKVQIAFDGEYPGTPPDMELLSESSVGRVHTLIVRGNRSVVTMRLSALNPIFLDTIPLTLEEIFIYELGGMEYGVKTVVM